MKKLLSSVSLAALAFCFALQPSYGMDEDPTDSPSKGVKRTRDEKNVNASKRQKTLHLAETPIGTDPFSCPHFTYQYLWNGVFACITSHFDSDETKRPLLKAYRNHWETIAGNKVRILYHPLNFDINSQINVSQIVTLRLMNHQFKLMVDSHIIGLDFSRLARNDFEIVK